jgi:hypothetical protein
MAQPIALRDRHAARQHHEHAGSRLAGLKKPFAAGIFSQRPERRQPVDLGRRQRREGFLERAMSRC